MRSRWPRPNTQNPFSSFAIIDGAKSMPVTRCPRDASSRLKKPVPQPMSSTSSAPAAGRIKSRIRSQAARSAGLRMLWPKSASKCAARRFQ